MKRKAKSEPILGRDPVSQLYRAVIRYVESHKGSIVVIGGIQIQEWPDELPYKFMVAVKCTGTKPELPEGQRPQARRKA